MFGILVATIVGLLGYVFRQKIFTSATYLPPSFFFGGR